MFSETKSSKIDNSGLTNRIVKSTIIKGDIISETDFRIDGELEGNAKVAGKLVIGKTAIVNGNIECEHIDVEGEFYGDILAKGLLSIKATAKLEGTVITKKLAVEQGALFNATCNMKDAGDTSKNTLVNKNNLTPLEKNDQKKKAVGNYN